MKFRQHITLRHLSIDNKRYIGLEFYANKALDIIIKELIEVAWSDLFNMYYVPNTQDHLNAIYRLFRGVAWVDSKYFFQSSRSKQLRETFDIKWFRKRKRDPKFKFCPEYIYKN